MTFAKTILPLLLALNCHAQFLPMLGHVAGNTNVTKVDVLPPIWMTNNLFAVWHLDDTNSSRASDSWGTNHLYFRSATNVSLTTGVFGNAVNVGAANTAGELTNNAGGMTFKTLTVSWWQAQGHNLAQPIFTAVPTQPAAHGTNLALGARSPTQPCVWR